MAKKKEFLVYLVGPGNGCDHTIGCNHAVRFIEAVNLADASRIVEDKLLPDFGKDRVESARIYEIRTSHEVDMDAYWERQRKIESAARELEEVMAREEKDRREYARLKKKFEQGIEEPEKRTPAKWSSEWWAEMETGCCWPDGSKARPKHWQCVTFNELTWSTLQVAIGSFVGDVAISMAAGYYNELADKPAPFPVRPLTQVPCAVEADWDGRRVVFYLGRMGCKSEHGLDLRWGVFYIRPAWERLLNGPKR